MSDYLLLFGNTPQLSRLEFESLYPDLVLRDYSEQLFAVSVDLDPTAETEFLRKLVSDCAGIVKVFKVEEKISNQISDQDLLVKLADLVLVHSPKAHFSLQQIGKQQRNISNEDLKDYLKEEGTNARYFTGALTATALLLHRSKATELLLVNSAEEEILFLARIAAVQNIDNWTKKDRQKPYADRKKGMLPPKVALMMVNIAFGNRQGALGEAANQKALLYDPFCGSGTVLMEAALRDLDVIGSDLDQKAVDGTKENLNWLGEAYQLDINADIFQAAVAHLPAEKFAQRKVDLLVSEPFLGRQTPREQDLANIFKGLEKLYLGAFNSFSSILSQQARICIVFPRVTTEKRSYSMANLIDKLQARGYNLLVKPVLYAREGAQIQREICLFSFERRVS